MSQPLWAILGNLGKCIVPFYGEIKNVCFMNFCEVVMEKFTKYLTEFHTVPKEMVTRVG